MGWMPRRWRRTRRCAPIVRRDTDETYHEFLTRLAKESGIATSTREQLARLDRKRARKGSNEEWVHPQVPDARITKYEGWGTHLRHKAEHAVDLETGAVVAVTLAAADSVLKGLEASSPVCFRLELTES